MIVGGVAGGAAAKTRQRTGGEHHVRERASCVRCQLSGQTFLEAYDKLILSPGAPMPRSSLRPKTPLDVRESDEYRYEHIAKTMNAPLSRLQETRATLPKDKDLYVLFKNVNTEAVTSTYKRKKKEALCYPP